ncbi:MAG TPA: class I SAM-dependent methyltransferase [Isosphaeraceae bacterium]|jgi:ubiquinone/menaquinone biosynthesis C-methylase UbiE|nr:class I SAM-dependent methyltransferase [Isosphaeraceae bacterium]
MSALLMEAALIPAAAEYDGFARQYKKSKELPFRAHVEAHTFFRMLGDVNGLDLLDLACGEGHYSRQIRRRGAARVVGADLSAEMIALARQQEDRNPIGVEYILAPAEQLGVVGAFDVVTAAYLLNCAPTRRHLEAMCRTIAANLRPGGRFVAINTGYDIGPPADTAKYGWRTTAETTGVDGGERRLTFLLGADSFTITNYAHSRASYDAALRAAGFKTIRWVMPTVAEAGIAEFGREYWNVMLDEAPIVGLDCRL